MSNIAGGENEISSRWILKTTEKAISIFRFLKFRFNKWYNEYNMIGYNGIQFE